MATGFKRGRLRDVIEYFFAYPNQDISIAELEKHFEGMYSRTQILGTLSHITGERGQQTNGTPIKTTNRKWVWRLCVDANGEPQAPTEMAALKVVKKSMVVEIVVEREGYTIVEGPDNILYKLIKLG